MKTRKILGRAGISASLLLIGMALAMILTFGFTREFNVLFVISVTLLGASHVVLYQVRKEEEE